MERRSFITTSCLAGLAAPLIGAAPAAWGQSDRMARDFYEWRIYRQASEDKARTLDAFMKNAAIPAFNRMGVEPVGAFHERDKPLSDLYLLLRYKKLETFINASSVLMADETFLKDGKDVIEATSDDPAYARIESSFMLAFEECPVVEVPEKKDGRVYELRIYESHSLIKHKKKVEMFDGGGEIAIFRKTGLHPVFFGETLIGEKLPNLTYMITCDDQDAHRSAWAAFRDHPDWVALRGKEEYADTVSNIVNVFLTAKDYSQV